MTRGRSFYPVTKLMSPEVGKWVTVNVNGNTHHESRILISPYSMRKFENLLSHLTEKLNPPFGAVWHLFTENGTEIKDLEEIKGGYTYIASGRAKPLFPVRMGAKGQGRSRRGRDGELPQLRSHSAVGTLGGRHSGHRAPGGLGRLGGSGGAGGAAAAPGKVLDTSSDTNVKHKPCSPSARPRAAPCRPAPAPRRGKARTRAGEQGVATGEMWDGPLHSQQQNHYQQPLLSTKRKLSANKTQHVEDCESDDNSNRVEGMSFKSHVRGSNQQNFKTTSEGRIFTQAKLKP